MTERTSPSGNLTIDDEGYGYFWINDTPEGSLAIDADDAAWLERELHGWLVHQAASNIERACDLGMSFEEARREVEKAQRVYTIARDTGRLPTTAAYLGRILQYLHDYVPASAMPWSATWLAEQVLAALDREMEHANLTLVALTPDQALALRNVILPRLVDLEQHGYTEEYDGEGKDLRSIGNVLEKAVRRSADRGGDEP